MNTSKLQILIVEWMGYPLFRKKTIATNTIDCGLAPLLKGMDKYNAGIDFECTTIINQYQNKSPHPMISLMDRFTTLKPLLINNISTNSEDKYNRLLSRYNFINRVFYRENLNQDIGAYDYFYKNLRDQGYRGQVLLLNSSVRGPKEHNWLLKYKQLFDMEPDTGLCGISLNSEYYKYSGEQRPFVPHVQSFCLFTSMDVLEKVFPNGFLADQYRERQLDKDELIINGEIGISNRILEAGYGIRCSAFPQFYYKKDGRQWTIPHGDIRFYQEYYHLANQC